MLDQRHDALDLLLDAHLRAPGAGGLSADVQDVRPVREQLTRQLDLRLQRPEPPAIAEGVGRGVDDAHQPRTPAQLEHAINGTHAIRGFAHGEGSVER